jgi:hypothetical protein
VTLWISSRVSGGGGCCWRARRLRLVSCVWGGVCGGVCVSCDDPLTPADLRQHPPPIPPGEALAPLVAPLPLELRPKMEAFIRNCYEVGGGCFHIIMNLYGSGCSD